MGKQKFAYSNPYRNKHEGDLPRLLFVCSVGMLRSPTFADVANKMQFNARSCGVDAEALIQITPRLVLWSDKIVFMHKEIFDAAIWKFEDDDLGFEIRHRAVVLDIPDDYNKNDPWLVGQATAFLLKLKAESES